MNIRQLEQIIERYLAGAATPEEREFVQSWLERQGKSGAGVEPSKRDQLQARLWAVIDQETAEDRAPDAMREGREVRGMRLRLGGRKREEKGMELRLGRRVVWMGRKALRYAAIVFVLVAGAAVYFSLTHRNSSGAEGTLYITAVPGQPRTYLLPDSSKVYLFPHSTLGIPADYGKSDRSITVSGRAFLDIHPDAVHPFYVRSGQLTTRVLGTSFEVASTDGATVSVVVRTGKVSVEYAHRQLGALLPDERLRYDPSKGQAVKDTVDAALVCEWWKTGIAFQQTPLQDVVRTMSDWYNVPIRISNKKWLEETVTIRFRGQPLDSAMLLLSGTLGFGYERHQNELIIY